MKVRTAATTIASAAALLLAFAPAGASTTTTVSDSFSSPTGDPASTKQAPADRSPLPTAGVRAGQRAAAAAAADPITKYYVRGYQTLYQAGDNDIAADVAVDTGGADYCSIESRMNVNGKDLTLTAWSFAGDAYPEDVSGPYGGPLMPAVYGAATYRFGPHDIRFPGPDNTCGNADDTVEVSQYLSNPVRIRYRSKGIVQFSKSGSRIKVHNLAQRFDKSGTYVGLRSVRLEYRKGTSGAWTAKKTLPLDTTGRGDYSFTSSAKYYYRIAIVLTDNVQSSYSTPKYL